MSPHSTGDEDKLQKSGYGLLRKERGNVNRMLANREENCPQRFAQ
jgi:hypothetical protein